MFCDTTIGARSYAFDEWVVWKDVRMGVGGKWTWGESINPWDDVKGSARDKGGNDSEPGRVFKIGRGIITQPLLDTRVWVCDSTAEDGNAGSSQEEWKVIQVFQQSRWPTLYISSQEQYLSHNSNTLDRIGTFPFRRTVRPSVRVACKCAGRKYTTQQQGCVFVVRDVEHITWLIECKHRYFRLVLVGKEMIRPGWDFYLITFLGRVIWK